MISKTAIIEISDSGRCDRVLRNSLISGKEWLSRSSWEWLFHAKRIRKNGKVLRAGDTVSAGDCVEIEFPGAVSGVLPGLEPAELIHLDKDWLFVNKPAGVPTLPQHPWENDCFANRVAKLLEERNLKSAEEFSRLAEPPILEGGLVQRLDNETSGGILVALNATRKIKFREWISEGKITKTYLAVTSGIPIKGRSSFLVGEKNAEFYVDVLSQTENNALVRVRTMQGMRHIVRVGLAKLGAPIVGDRAYGDGKAILSSYPFHLLHAETVKIPDTVDLHAKIPSGFYETLQKLNLDVPDET